MSRCFPRVTNWRRAARSGVIEDEKGDGNILDCKEEVFPVSREREAIAMSVG